MMGYLDRRMFVMMADQVFFPVVMAAAAAMGVDFSTQAGMCMGRDMAFAMGMTGLCHSPCQFLRISFRSVHTLFSVMPETADRTILIAAADFFQVL